jgi:hypothetical protein
VLRRTSSNIPASSSVEIQGRGHAVAQTAICRGIEARPASWRIRSAAVIRSERILGRRTSTGAFGMIDAGEG